MYEENVANILLLDLARQFFRVIEVKEKYVATISPHDFLMKISGLRRKLTIACIQNSWKDRNKAGQFCPTVDSDRWSVVMRYIVLFELSMV